MTAQRGLIIRNPWRPAVAVVAAELCICLGAMSSEALALSRALSWSELEIPHRPATTAELVERGGGLFAEHCAACHGESGEGNGVCADFQQPQPRDMTVGVYRFKSTPGSELASDQDLFRTVTVGLNGTSMPPFDSLLSPEERWAVVLFIRTLSPRFTPAVSEVSVDLGQEPQPTNQGQLDRGQELFSLLRCTECHGRGGRGDGPSSGTLLDSSGQPISPRDLTRLEDFKRGHSPRDIALTIATGLPGTPMPAYDAALEIGDLWALAGYVQSLTNPAGVEGTEDLTGSGDLPPDAAVGFHDGVVTITVSRWNLVPNSFEIRQGDVVRLRVIAADNGAGAGYSLTIPEMEAEALMEDIVVGRPSSVTLLASEPGRFRIHETNPCNQQGGQNGSFDGLMIVKPKSEP